MSQSRSSFGRPAAVLGLLLLLLGALLPGRAPAQVGSVPVFNPATGRWYEAVTVAGGITWNSARTAAAARSYQGHTGYLATFTTAEEDQWVSTTFPQASSNKYLFGGYQAEGSAEPAGGWRWITDEPWLYTRWDAGEPNNVPAPSEEALAYSANGRWNDTTYGTLHPGYVVEYGDFDVPPPISPITFVTPPVQIPVSAPMDISAFDFDQDGHLDLVAASNNDIALFYGNGDGGFSPPLYLGLNAPIMQTVAADVDGDGDLDVLATGGTRVFVLRRVAARTYALPEIYPVVNSRTWGLHARDFTGDGRPDLAVSDHDGHGLLIMLNTGTGAFAAPVRYAAGSFPGRITSADWNGDGRIDLAMTNIVDGNVNRYFGTGGGAFSVQSRVSTNGSYPTQIVTVDFTGDGLLDLVTANTFGHTVAVLRGNGNGTFQPGVTAAGNTYPHILATADLDLDGDPDIVAPNNGTNYFTVIRNSGGVMSPPLDFPSYGENSRTMAVGDFDEDGRTDVAVASEDTDNIAVFVNSTAFPAPVAPIGLISWWRAEGNAEDATGRNPGQVVGSTFAPGVKGQAFYFDSPTDGINVADSESLKLTKSMTLAAWFNVETIPPPTKGGYIFIRGDNVIGSVPIRFVIQNTGHIAFGITSLTATDYIQTPIQTNRWYHAAATLDDATGVMKLYLNGVLMEQLTTSVRPMRDLNPTRSPGCGIGNVQAQPNAEHSHPFRGRIDEMQVYDRALTPEEILDLVGSVPAAPAAPSNLTATLVSDSEIELTWQDNSDNETSFELERRIAAGSFAPIASLAANATVHRNGNLSANTSYSYRVRAVNGFGASAYSNVATRSTPPPPPPPAAPSNLQVTPFSATDLDLTWQDNSTTEAQFRVELKNADSSFTVLGVTAPNVTQYRHSALAPNTRYTYRVRASNGSGASGYTNEASGLTLPLPPATFTVKAVSSSRLDLEWTDGNATATGHRVERSGDGGTTYLEVAALGPGIGSHADTGLEPDREYRFRLRAVNSSGYSVYTAPRAARTYALPPGQPTQLDATYQLGLGMRLAWVLGGGGTPEGVKIERSENAGGTFTEIAIAPGAATSHTDATAQPDRVYLYRVRAYNSGGASLPSVGATRATPPATPTGLSVTNLAAGSLTLTWNDTSSTETGFRLERKIGEGVFELLIELGANTTTYSDTTLTSNSSYSYRVRAFGPGGDSAWSNVAGTSTAPQPPSALQAVGLSTTTIRVTWTDANSTAVSHRVEWAATADGPFVLLTQANPGTTEVTHTGRSANTTYHYRVRAMGVTGDSAFTGPAAGLTYPDAPAALQVAPMGPGQLRVSWVNANPSPAAHRVYRSDDGGSTFTPRQLVPAGTSQWDDASLQPNTTYHYRVAASNATGDSSVSSPVSGLTLPAAPTGLQVAGLSQTRVRVQWTDANPIPAQHRVERSSDGGTSFIQFATVAAGTSQWEQDGLTAGSTYLYRVRAFNASGPSPYAGPTSGGSLPAPPPAPANLQASFAGPSRVDLKWSDTASNETGFQIERRTPSTQFALLDTVAANATGYSDLTVGAEATYLYRVRAVNTGGPSAYTPEATATRPQGGKLVVTPLKLNYGTIRHRRVVKKNVLIRNTGRGPLGISVGTLSGPYRIASGSGAFTLAPRKAHTVKLEFTPTTAGKHEAALIITSTDPAKPTVTVTQTATVR